MENKVLIILDATTVQEAITALADAVNGMRLQLKYTEKQLGDEREKNANADDLIKQNDEYKKLIDKLKAKLEKEEEF